MARRQTGGQTKAMLFLLVSLVGAVASTAVVYNIFSNLNAELENAEIEEVLTTVVRSTTTLYQGEQITAEQLEVIEISKDFIPANAFTSIEEALGRVPKERILTREIIRAERLAAPEAGVGSTAIIPRGMRAMNVKISHATGVSGFIMPGNYVDVLITLQDSEKGQGTLTKDLLQAVYVIAVNASLGGQSDKKKGGGSPSVTLALTPQEVQLLAQAHVQGKITLTLRNDVDVTNVHMNDSQLTALIGREQTKVAPVKPTAATKRKSRPTIKVPQKTLTLIKGSHVQHKKLK